MKAMSILLLLVALLSIAVIVQGQDKPAPPAQATTKPQAKPDGEMWKKGAELWIREGGQDIQLMRMPAVQLSMLNTLESEVTEHIKFWRFRDTNSKSKSNRKGGG